MKKLFFIVSLLLMLSCDPPRPAAQDLSKIKQLDWLPGHWENISEEGELYESWAKTNDSTYTGKSIMTVKGDTVFSENITLKLRNNDLYYVPVVSDQNNGRSVSFKFVTVNDGEFIFENKTHDFPQRVIYKNPHPDSLYARIEGNENGKFRKEEFSMTKQK